MGGVAGLALQVQPSGARSWLLRISIAGRRREMGCVCGRLPRCLLADARRRARDEREKADKGIDPIADRRAGVVRLRAESARKCSFESAARTYIEVHEPTWRNAKHAEQWRNTLASTFPLIGSLQVQEIGLPEVLGVLGAPFGKQRLSPRPTPSRANRVRPRLGGGPRLSRRPQPGSMAWTSRPIIARATQDCEGRAPRRDTGQATQDIHGLPSSARRH